MKLRIHRGVSAYRTAAKAAVRNNFAQPATNLLSRRSPKTSLPILCDLTLPRTHQNAFVKMCAALLLRDCHSKNTFGLRVSISIPVLKKRENNSKICTFNIGFSTFFFPPEEAGQLVQ